MLHRKSRRAAFLATGDWIKTYEGKRVRDAAHLAQLSAATAGGEPIIHLVVVRDKKEIRLPALNGLLDAELLDVSGASSAGHPQGAEASPKRAAVSYKKTEHGPDANRPVPLTRNPAHTRHRL